MKTPGTLLIRTDAGTEIGHGHVMRCLALAQAWQDRGGSCVFAVAGEIGALKEWLSLENCSITRIAAVPGNNEDLKQLLTAAQRVNPRWVVVDGYHFSAEYHRSLRETGHKVLVIDDDGSAEHFADIVLDQNAGAEETSYAQCKEHTKRLLGPRFALLRREFRAWHRWHREIPGVARKVLVTMGGSDPRNITKRVVEALAALGDRQLEIRVVAGASYNKLDTLKSWVAGQDDRFTVVADPKNMPELMQWADLAVSAAGSTCWEMCLAGLPAVIMDIAENQGAIARELSGRGIALHVPSSQATAETIVASVESLLLDPERRAAMSSRARQLVDGYGAIRVVAAMRAHGCTLRRASQSDCRILWQWANDPHVRQASFSSDSIPWEAHCRWFSQKVSEPNCLFLMFESEGTPVATIRTQNTPSSDVEMSITMSAEYRGQGLAPMLLERAVEAVFAATKADNVHAFIKPENRASLRAFENAGFLLLGTTQVKGSQALRYLRERAPITSARARVRADAMQGVLSW